MGKGMRYEGRCRQEKLIEHKTSIFPHGKKGRNACAPQGTRLEAWNLLDMVGSPYLRYC